MNTANRRSVPDMLNREETEKRLRAFDPPFPEDMIAEILSAPRAVLVEASTDKDIPPQCREQAHSVIAIIAAHVQWLDAPPVTGADVRVGENGTVSLTFTNANGVACAVVLGPGLPEELARRLAHTTAYPWQNHAPVMVHCPRHPTRRIACGATCDMCLAEVASCISASDGIRFGARVKVTRRKERDNGYDAAARAVRESHDGQVGTAEDYPPMTCVWLVRFSDGSRVGYNVDELTFVPGPAASLAESGVTT